METINATSATGNEKLLRSVQPNELRGSRDDVFLLDVREPGEFAGGRIAGSRNIPLGELPRNSAALPDDKTIVCVCRTGRRASQAAEALRSAGRSNLVCLEGGLTAWEKAGLPVDKDANAPWALERQVRFAAGLLILIGLGLSLLWPPAIALSWFVGAGLVFAAVTDWCGMGLLLAKAPWNRRGGRR